MTGKLVINSLVCVRITLLVYATLQATLLLAGQDRIDSSMVFTSDGAWCWFSDPRAIYVHGDNPGILAGWVTSNGSIEAGIMDMKGEIKTQTLAYNLDKDDHANPSFLELNDSLYMIFYSKHIDEYIRYHKSSLNGDSLFGNLFLHDPFDENELQRFPRRMVTYVNPVVLENEGDKIYCFGRWTGFKPNMISSTDKGTTFSKSRVFITNYPFDENNRPYVKYFSDGRSKIHITFTDGHPRMESLNSVYYTSYEDGFFKKADGSGICSLNEVPFEPKDASLVYQADSSTGKSWIYDIAADSVEYPVILYACYPSDSSHIYYYTRFNGDEWVRSYICNSGDWFPQTPNGKSEPEPNYSGGMTVHPLETSRIYVSEKVKGVFEIIKYEFDDDGTIIRRTAITRNSKLDNVRPYVPRNMRMGDLTLVLWMQIRKYIHYTDYKSSIRFYIDN